MTSDECQCPSCRGDLAFLLAEARRERDEARAALADLRRIAAEIAVRGRLEPLRVNDCRALLGIPPHPDDVEREPAPYRSEPMTVHADTPTIRATPSPYRTGVVDPGSPPLFGRRRTTGDIPTEFERPLIRFPWRRR